mmetsp:Transcript_2439/g.5119  ORF Transcript_2439/g.5119 Transcript_2439/m.5119 type:complete len:534 (-) Transcript_2439:6134-7735(-)
MMYVIRARQKCSRRRSTLQLLLLPFAISSLLLSRTSCAFLSVSETRAVRSAYMSMHEPTSAVARSLRAQTSDADAEKTESVESLLDEINGMRVKEIKNELKSLGVGTEDVFEKKELVERLAKARKGEIKSEIRGGANSKQRSNGDSSAASSSASGEGIEVPLVFYSLESFSSVDASNTAQSVYVRPSPGQFACIKAELPNPGRTLTLLVDTACTGLVLRPSTVQRLGIPNLSNALGSMNAAGGNVANAAVAQVESLKIGSINVGAMPAAVQDIGAMPSPIDGIIGLSFLKEFATVDMCFSTGRLSLFRRNLNPPVGSDTKKVTELAKTQMRMTRLGIWTASVLLDGRGPVTMLVDTGAASTILNWKGLEQMGLDRSSPQVGPTPQEIGAIGADNVALRLTHRYVLKDGFNLVEGRSKGDENASLPGVSMKDGATINIDIGSIPVLDSLGSEGVGGILGADLLMRCDLVRLNFKGTREGMFSLYGSPSSGFPKVSGEERDVVKPSTTAPEGSSALSSPKEEPIRRRKKKKIRSD